MKRKADIVKDSLSGPAVKTSPSKVEGMASIPDWEAEILLASWPKNQNIKQKHYCNRFNKRLFKWSELKKSIHCEITPVKLHLTLEKHSSWWCPLLCSGKPTCDF